MSFSTNSNTKLSYVNKKITIYEEHYPKHGDVKNYRK